MAGKVLCIFMDNTEESYHLREALEESDEMFSLSYQILSIRRNSKLELHYAKTIKHLYQLV